MRPSWWRAVVLYSVIWVTWGQGDTLCQRPFSRRAHVTSFGSNDHMQQGDTASGTFPSRSRPGPVCFGSQCLVVVPLWEDSVAVHASLFHSILRLDAKQVYVGGDNQAGQLGLGPREVGRREVPFTLVDTLVERGADAPREVQGVFTAKESQYKVVNACSGWQHSCLLVEKSRVNKVYCSGLNLYGQLGVGTWLTSVLGTNFTFFAEVTFTDNSGQPIEDPDLSVIGCGAYHTLAASAVGELYAWGWNDAGQLGIKDGAKGPDRVYEPRRIDFKLDGDREAIRKVDGGYQHSAIYLNTGRLAVFGSNVEGQLGDPLLGDSVDTPTRLNSTIEWKDVSLGGYHTVGRDKDGRVFTWGEGTIGQIGQAPNASDMGRRWMQRTPREVVFPPRPGDDNKVDVRFITAGHKHTAVVDACGDVYTFGSDAFGQLGLGGTSPDVLMRRMTPQKVDAVGNASAVVAGGFHTFVLQDEPT